MRNPMNYHQVSKISLAPELMDGIVFWTKNPIRMLDRLDLLKLYMFYFQFTITAFGKDIEPNIPDKYELIIPAFQRLSDRIGVNRVIWRYDPILISEWYTLHEHIQAFERIASNLHRYTQWVTISFVDEEYRA